MSTSSYYTKTIRHYGNELAILMQNENGPCPLLAIANVLILRGGIHIHPDIAEISFEDLTARMAEYMLDQSATLSETDEVLRANQQRNIADGMALFPKLQRGLDVNVGFTRVDAFEYSEDQVIFDLLSVRLVHGWLEPLVETRLGISQVPPGGSGRSLDPSTATAAAQGGAL